MFIIENYKNSNTLTCLIHLFIIAKEEEIRYEAI